MGAACCGGTEPEKQVTQSDGELAGKAKFLSTPSFCEFSDTANVLGGCLPHFSGSGAAPTSDADKLAAARSASTPGLGSAVKWFLCVFAPLNGQGLSFSAYQPRTNTLMVKYLTDAEIVKEKDAQNISITYNMFFKALSTEVARAGRVGAKVSFVNKDTIAMDCKIMIAGATSRRPDNFHVELKRVANVTPTELYSYVVEPVCTQYYKRRANEGWNVERVDVSREKIYGEYETNFILRSHRLNRSLSMLRELVPRVLQLRRDRNELRAKRDSLLAQLAVARSMLASSDPAPERLIDALPQAQKVEMLGEKVAATYRERRRAPPSASHGGPSSPDPMAHSTDVLPTSPSTFGRGDNVKMDIGANSANSNTNEAGGASSSINKASSSGKPFREKHYDHLYPTLGDPSLNLKLPRGIFLSSMMPNRHVPIPDFIPTNEGGAEAAANLSSTSQSASTSSPTAVEKTNNSNVPAKVQADDFAFGNAMGAPASTGIYEPADRPRKNKYCSLKAIELCMMLGDRIDVDLRAFERKHPPIVKPGQHHHSPGGRLLGDTTPLGSGIYSLPHLVGGSTPGSPHQAAGLTPEKQGQQQTPNNAGGGNDSFNLGGGGGSDMFGGQSFAAPPEDYFVYDYGIFPEDVQKRFASLPGGESERCAIFRCWRSFVSVSRFDAFTIDTMSDGHVCALALALALSVHGVCQELRLSSATVHDLCCRVELLHSRNEEFFNSVRAADRLQFMSLFLKVVQSGEVPRLSGVPAIEKFCVLIAAASCRTDLHPPLEPFAQPCATLAALYVDSVNERHALAVTVAALRQNPAIAKFIVPHVHMLLSDFFLAVDPARHGSILSSFLGKIKSAANFSRSLAERRLMLSVLLIGADCAFFARVPHVKDMWSRKLDTAGAVTKIPTVAQSRMRRFSADLNLELGASRKNAAASPAEVSLTELRSPLKINLPTTFRIGAASGFNGGPGAGADEVQPSCLILRSEMIAGAVGKTTAGAGPSGNPVTAIPHCMQGVTKRSHEVYESIVTPVFSCLRTLAQESLEAAQNAQTGGGEKSETTRDATYSVFARIAQCGLYG